MNKNIGLPSIILSSLFITTTITGRDFFMSSEARTFFLITCDNEKVIFEDLNNESLSLNPFSTFFTIYHPTYDEIINNCN